MAIMPISHRNALPAIRPSPIVTTCSPIPLPCHSRSMAQCPRGTGSDLDRCCGPLIFGSTAASTAEALMRSGCPVLGGFCCKPLAASISEFFDRM